MTAVMLVAGRVLRDGLGGMPHAARALEEDSVAVIMADVLVRDAHAFANAVEGFLEGGGGEEGEVSVLGPLFAHEALGLERGGPVDGAAAAEVGAG